MAFLGISDPVDTSTTVASVSSSNPEMSASNSVSSTELTDLDRVFTNSTSLSSSFAPAKLTSSDMNAALVKNNYSADVLLSGDTTGIPSLTPLSPCKYHLMLI